MQAQNRKKQAPKVRPTREKRKESLMKGVILKFKMIASLFSIDNEQDKIRAGRKAYHYAYGGGGNPIFIPRYHPVMNYRTQQRNALKRRRAR